MKKDNFYNEFYKIMDERIEDFIKTKKDNNYSYTPDKNNFEIYLEYIKTTRRPNYEDFKKFKRDYVNK